MNKQIDLNISGTPTCCNCQQPTNDYKLVFRDMNVSNGHVSVVAVKCVSNCTKYSIFKKQSRPSSVDFAVSR